MAGHKIAVLHFVMIGASFGFLFLKPLRWRIFSGVLAIALAAASLICLINYCV